MQSHKTDGHMVLLIVTGVMLTLVPDTYGVCSQSVQHELTGPFWNEIPRNLDKNITKLILSDTNISVLNLTVAVEYPVMCILEVDSSPVSTIITPSPPQSLALINFRLASGNFSTPPDLGCVLTEKLKNLKFVNIGIFIVPDNYFQNFTNLISLSLVMNPITTLNKGSLAGLRHLRHLYLSYTNINPLPPLHLWLPNLQSLLLTHIGITMLRGSLVRNLPQLEKIDLRGNLLTTVPAQKYFVNLENMKMVSLRGNPLQCDAKLCWIKVILNKHENCEWRTMQNYILILTYQKITYSIKLYLHLLSFIEFTVIAQVGDRVSIVVVLHQFTRNIDG